MVNGKQVFAGRELAVRVLYSAAGVATTIVLENRRGGDLLLLDCGDGTLRDLLDAGLHPEWLSGIVLSHGHFDHLGGLHSVLGFLRMIGRDEALTVAYPAGCLEAEGLLNNFQTLYPDCSFAFDLTPLEDGDILQLESWSIEVLAVEHAGSTAAGVGEAVPALGCRVELGAETAAYSGDSGPCDALEEICSAADIALIEATWDASSPFDGGERVHLTRDEAAAYGALARRFELVHRRRER